MTKSEKEETLRAAGKLASDFFNALPFETRKKLANGYERLLEVKLLLGQGDRLSLATIKKRKQELEQWLLNWYREQQNDNPKGCK